MFGLGFWEIIVILVVALVVLGPERLPKLGQDLGKMARDLRRAMNDMRTTVEEEVARSDYGQEIKGIIEPKGEVPTEAASDKHEN